MHVIVAMPISPKIADTKPTPKNPPSKDGIITRLMGDLRDVQQKNEFQTRIIQEKDLEIERLNGQITRLHQELHGLRREHRAAALRLHNSRLVRIWQVRHDSHDIADTTRIEIGPGTHSVEADDGTTVVSFVLPGAAMAFAEKCSCYGRPAVAVGRRVTLAWAAARGLA